jgi:hypothetical protein
MTDKAAQRKLLGLLWLLFSMFFGITEPENALSNFIFCFVFLGVVGVLVYLFTLPSIRRREAIQIEQRRRDYDREREELIEQERRSKLTEGERMNEVADRLENSWRQIMAEVEQQKAAASQLGAKPTG